MAQENKFPKCFVVCQAIQELGSDLIVSGMNSSEVQCSLSAMQVTYNQETNSYLLANLSFPVVQALSISLDRMFKQERFVTKSGENLQISARRANEIVMAYNQVNDGAKSPSKKSPKKRGRKKNPSGKNTNRAETSALQMSTARPSSDSRTPMKADNSDVVLDYGSVRNTAASQAPRQRADSTTSNGSRHDFVVLSAPRADRRVRAGSRISYQHSSTNQDSLKSDFLSTLKDLVDDRKWDAKGVGFFSKKTPRYIARLRTVLSAYEYALGEAGRSISGFKKIDECTFNKIRNILIEANAVSPLFRAPDVDDFYQTQQEALEAIRMSAWVHSHRL